MRTFIEFIYEKSYLHYEQIAYRQLNINFDDMVNYIHTYNINKYENIENYTIECMSTNEIKNKFYKIINQKVEIFMQNNRNAVYDFPYCKYLCKPKKTKNVGNINRSTYFCSELVAAIYMFCNIISRKYDPIDYLPGRFGEKGEIEFKNGFHLGPEIIIEFSD